MNIGIVLIAFGLGIVLLCLMPVFSEDWGRESASDALFGAGVGAPIAAIGLGLVFA